MRDFPLFTTQSGVASLTMKEIPYTGDAYVTIRQASDFSALIDECVDFCKAVGASRIYASGDGRLCEYPFFTAIWQMQASVESVGQTEASLFPVQEKTLEKFRKIYNDKMKKIPASSYMNQRDAEKMLTEASGYFIHKEGVLLGIGMVSADQILNVISVKTGAGKDVLRALVSTVTSETVNLAVASANKKAIALYERCGFCKISEGPVWYQIL